MSRATGDADPRGPGSTASEIALGVFVGGRADAPSFQGARVCVLDQPDPGVIADLQLPVHDSATRRPKLQNLEGVVRFVETARRRGDPVLIFCGHGVQRGPLAGAYYLHRIDGITLDEAYARIRKVRPQVESAHRWLRDWRILEAGPDSARGETR